MKNVLEYLETAADKFPDKIAVADKTSRLTYSELRSVSKNIGSYIAVLNKKNSPVCVYAEHNVNTLAYFFGVLYSGNYYVPVDPDMPAEKKQMIFDDCRPFAVCGNADDNVSMGECLLVNIQKDNLLSIGGGITPKKNSDTDELPSDKFEENESDKPIYMVYTSGSTGKPKGVLKSHNAVISFVEAYDEEFKFSQNEIIGNQTPFFFDASAKDIYLSLKLGATIEILASTLFAMPTELIEYMNERKVSFVSWVPTAISIVAQLNPFSYVKPDYLKKVFFVGEVMPMKHLNKWRKALPEIEYVNLYGSSEVAGVSCYYRVQRDFADDETLPMGKPLSHCKTYLKDGETVINEPGKTGELYICSPSAALCYFNDAEKTAKAFLTVDFGNGPELCFKTGDLAQFDTSGNLIFVSRCDFQIKHMGRRIELGEIESVAGALSGIQACCCLYNPEKKKIILFCQLEPDSILTDSQIKNILKEKLSSYMLPGKIIIIDRLPTNANGKIDRQKLKEML